MVSYSKVKRIFAENGLLYTSEAAVRYVLSIVYTYLSVCHVMVKFRTLRPRINTDIWVDPSDINYALPTRNEPDTRLRHGILGGDWDKQKNEFWTPFRRGLRQRFAEGKPWDETEYYETAVAKLQDGGELRRLDYEEQTIENLKRYLDEIADLYKDIRDNGYDPSFPIVVCIGREGEIMINEGNHRAVISRVLNIERIPANVRYRHADWQKIREQFKSYEDMSDVPDDRKKYIGHPDVPELSGN